MTISNQCMQEQSTVMKSVIATSIFLNIFQVVYMRVELSDFYPYGPENGDSVVSTNDDGSSGRVDIVFPFPFFDVDHKSLFVSSIYIFSVFIHEVLMLNNIICS